MSLRWRITAAVLAAVACCGVGLELTFRAVLERATAITLDRLDDLADSEVGRLELIRHQNLERVAALTSRWQLRRSLYQRECDGHRESLDRIRSILGPAAESIPGCRWIAVAEPGGRVVAATDASIEGTTLRDHRAFRGGLTGATVELRFRVPTEPALELAGPLLWEGELLGVVVAQTDARSLTSLVRDHDGFGRTSELLLAVATPGGDAGFVTRRRFEDEAVVPRTAGSDLTWLPVVRALLGREAGAARAMDYRHRRVLVATRHHAGFGVGLVAKIDEEEALAPIHRIRRSVALAEGSLFALLLAAAWTAGSALAAPLVRLQRAVRRVAGGERDVSVRTERRDEIGELSREFDALLASLRDTTASRDELREEVRARERAEAELRRSSAELRSACARLERTRERAEDLSRRAGQAEVAASVFHDVGNALSSLAVDVGLALESLPPARGDRLRAAAARFEGPPEAVAARLAANAGGIRTDELLRAVADELDATRCGTRERLVRVREGLDRVMAVVARHEPRARSFPLREVGVAELVTEAVELALSSRGRRPADVAVDLEGIAADTTLRSDPHGLLRVLVELIENALESVESGEPAGSTRDGDVPAAARALVRVRAVECGDDLAISVRDEGVGIAPEDLDRIFRSGFSTKAESRGFGLHDCANIAAQLGGAITVESDGAGRGALFTVRLPRAPRPESDASEAGGLAEAGSLVEAGVPSGEPSGGFRS